MLENKQNFLPPTSPFAISRQTIDFGSLAFIAASQHSGVIHELLTSVRKFEQLANSTERYSHIHVNELQPKMEEHGVAGGSVGTRDQAVTVAGESLMARLEALNQYIVENLDDTLLSLDKSMKDLRRVVGCKYKNAEFISKLEEPGDS